MANEEHVAMLKKGADAWNRWCDENVNIRPDLAHANLDRTDLFEANLAGADLTGASLTGASLAGADLTRANISKANLKRAHLTAATLRGADLTEADLTGANLNGADLAETTLQKTVFGFIPFDTVKGLEHCRHLGPSSINNLVLERSKPRFLLPSCAA